ncbi:energy-coupling factor ABC transporter ATP-binding protein, partial [Pediococcus acidilactici]
PKITKFAQQLVKRGLQLESLPITIEEFAEVVKHG